MASVPNARTDSTPISRLYNDLLLEVFSNLVCTKYDRQGRHLMNMIHYQSLLSTSQVCASWRKVTLKSSALWGHALDLDVLQKKSNSWIYEVMSRTKNAPLVVHRSLRPRSTAYALKNLSLLKSILFEEWSRISMLSVDLWNLPLSALGDVGELCRLLQSPAPELKLFSFFVHPDAGFRLTRFDPSPISTRQLIHRAAPHLHTYHSNQFWLSPSTRDEYRQLTSLSLPSWLTAVQILKILENLPLLTRLYLRDCLPYDPTVDAASLPEIILPNLETIYTEIYDPFMDVVDHIKPLRPCYLRVLCNMGDNIWFMDRVNSDTIRRIFKIFMKQDVDSVKIHIDRCSLSIAAYSYDRHVNKEECVFSFYANSPHGNFPDAHITWLFSLFASCHDVMAGIKRVTFLQIDIPEVVDWSASVFIRFCQAMVSIEHLNVCSCPVKYLARANLDLAWMFPSLKTLELGGIGWINLHHLLQVLDNWTLEPRSDMTSPKTLQLSPRVLEVDGTDLSCLDDKAIGLRVILGDGQEYVCGSGNPTILDFRAH